MRFATLIAIAFAAYGLADIAHEALGHGGACLALGGTILHLSTTTEFCSFPSRLIDGAGPVVPLVLAALLWVWLRLAAPRGQGTRLFLFMVFVFAALWNTGYMVKSGVTDLGDWAFVIKGLEPSLAWHVGLAAMGVVLYGASMRLAGDLMRERLAGPSGVPPLGFALAVVVAAGALSAAAAAFDPRGPLTILTDALPSSLASVGLIWVGWVTQRRAPDFRVAVPASPGWLVLGVASAVAFVAVLGPGLRF